MATPSLHLVGNSVNITLREATGLALCRSILEDLKTDDSSLKSRICKTASGEIIDYTSAVEILDEVVNKSICSN